VASQKSKIYIFNSESTLHADVHIDFVDGISALSCRQFDFGGPNVDSERRGIQCDRRNFLIERIDRTKSESVERWR